MQKKNRSNKKVLRICGVILGAGSIVVGISLFIRPVFDIILEKINSVTFVLVGIVFLIYGLTGLSVSRNR